MNATPINSIDYQSIPITKNDPDLMNDILEIPKKQEKGVEFDKDIKDLIILGIIYICINLTFFNEGLQKIFPTMIFENVDFNILFIKLVVLLGGFFIYKKYFY